MKDLDPRILFGFILLAGLIALAVVIGLGHVSQETSYGLDRIVDGLKNLTAFWAGWAFQGNYNGRGEKKN